MCDEDLLNLQNILQAVPRRGLKIILQRAKYIFPSLKDSLVRVLVCVRVLAHARTHTHTQKAVNVYFQKIIFWEHFANKLIFLLICQLNCLKFYAGIYLVLSILHCCCNGSNKYIVEKCIYSLYTGNIYTTGLYVH